MSKQQFANASELKIRDKSLNGRGEKMDGSNGSSDKAKEKYQQSGK